MTETKDSVNSEFVNGITFSRLTWREIINQFGAAPNVLSVSRIVFLPYVIFLVKHDMMPWSVVALAALWITDFIDGYIARKFQQQTELGLVLDPVADKVTSAALFITLYFYKDFPLWIVAVVLFKDFIILSCAVFLVRRRKLFSSNFYGRVSTVLIFLIILLYIINLDEYSFFLGYILMGIIFLTMVSYGMVFIRHLKL